MSLLGMKVGPTPQAAEAMCCLSHLSLYHQIQQKEASERLHSTSRSSAKRPVIPKNASLCILLSLFFVLAI